MGILISILGVFLGLRLLLFHVYCCLIACTEASAEASATLSFKPLAENLAEIKSQMEGDAVRTPLLQSARPRLFVDNGLPLILSPEVDFCSRHRAAFSTLGSRQAD